MCSLVCMGNKCKVSVVIAAYNAELFIGDTIRSVLCQSYLDYEIIIVDDCSVDRTVDVVNKISQQYDKVRLIALDENSGGPAKPRNVGVSHALGEWIAFLDADDIWHCRKLEIQMKLLSEGKYSICSTSMTDFSDIKDIESNLGSEVRSFDCVEVTFKKQLYKHKTPFSSLILKKSIALDFPFSDEAWLKGREDYLMGLKVHEYRGPSVKILYPLLFYRKHDDQISSVKY